MTGEARMMTSFNADARPRDILTWSIVFRPQALTIYIQFFERNVLNLTNSTTICNLGGRVSARLGGISLQLLRPTANDYQVTRWDSAAGISSALDFTGGSIYGDLIELCAQLYNDGSIQLHGVKNSGTLVSATATTARDIPTAWHNDTLYIGHDASGTNFGSQAIEHIGIWRGVLSLEKMRVKVSQSR